MSSQHQQSKKGNELDEFIRSIRRKNSRFVITKTNNDRAIIRLKGKFFGIFNHFNSPAVHYVQGIIDESVINQRKNSIKTETTTLYLGIQYTIAVLHIIFCIVIIVSNDPKILLLLPLSLILCLSANYGMYKIGKAIFLGYYFYEIEDGERMTKE